MNKPPSLSINKLLVSLCLLTLITACDEEETNNYTSTSTAPDTTPIQLKVDTDEDGLTDEEEMAYGTSIRLADTDGDGFSDFQEVIEFGFNPDNNNYRFNPLIADVAKLGIEVTSVPAVSLDFETEEGNSFTRSVERTQSQATSQTVSNSSSNSRAIEETHEVGVTYSASATVGLTDASVTAGYSLNYQYSHATTNESSVSYTKEQSKENTDALSEAEAIESSSSTRVTGGSLSLVMKVRNDSDLAFQVKGLSLGAVSLDARDRRSLVPVANLDVDSTYASFPEFTLPPHSSTDNLIFTAGLNVDTAKGLLRDPRGLILNVASSEIVDSNDVAFAFRETEINTKTATILIDYAGFKASERYLVATNVNLETGRLSVQDALNNILKISNSINDDGSLESIREQAASDRAYWVAVHVSHNGYGSAEVTTYSSQNVNDQVFADLELKSGDILDLSFMEDLDGDGVGVRSERIFGSNPDIFDTDDDGMSDGIELTGFDILIDMADGTTVTRHVTTSPTSDDSDGDDLLDTQECDMSTLICSSDPTLADTDGDRILDAFDPQPKSYSNLDLVNFDAYVQADKTTPFLDFTLPSVDDADISFAVYRQKVDDLETLCLSNEPGCVYTDVTANVVEDSSTPGHYTLSDTDGAELDKRFHYQVFLSVNDSPEILLQETPLNTIAAQKQFTVTLHSLQNVKCWDAIPLLDINISETIYNWDNRKLSCDLFGYVNVSGLNEDNRPVIAIEQSPLVVESGSNPGEFLRASVTFTVPDVPGQCIYIKPQLWEEEDNIDSSNAGDDRLTNANNYGSFRTQGSVHCQSDGWQAGQQVVPMRFKSSQNQFQWRFDPGVGFEINYDALVNAESATYEGLRENVEVEVVYDVTVTDVPAP
ncbi:MAG: hypothetical protein KUG78_09280 [Kangiellaceae bacterium]|nr:hypothetical protein [Kangiellaceae bacterium]